MTDDTNVSRAIRAQRASLEAYPGCRSSRAFVDLAGQLRRWPRERGPSGRLEFFFERLLATPPTRLKVIK